MPSSPGESAGTASTTHSLPGCTISQPGVAPFRRPPVSLPGQAPPIPFIVASGAGGKFDQNAEATPASNGFWHGYSLIHLDPASGKVTVEQRPILDWVSLTATTHVLRPGQTLTLDGVGREAFGIDQA